VLGAIDAALDLIPAMDDQRQFLQNNAAYLRQALHEMDWRTGNSSTQIIPVMIGKEAAALEFSNWLEENGILISAIRPPTVPEGASRVRLSLSALHTHNQIDRVIGLFGKWRIKN
jgi:8-amino-7-oxononanoate synthase